MTVLQCILLVEHKHNKSTLLTVAAWQMSLYGAIGQLLKQSSLWFMSKCIAIMSDDPKQINGHTCSGYQRVQEKESSDR